MTDIQKNEPLLQPDENRYVMFPIQYNDIWDMYKRSIDSFWHTGEISLAQDLNDWKSLKADEQNFIKMFYFQKQILILGLVQKLLCQSIFQKKSLIRTQF